MAAKIHFRRIIKLGKKKRLIPLCYKFQKYEIETTIDKEKVTCNMCKLILRGKK